MNEPFDMLTFANRLLAGMAARHSPATDEESDQGERWNAETQEQEQRSRGDALPAVPAATPRRG